MNHKKNGSEEDITRRKGYAIGTYKILGKIFNRKHVSEEISHSNLKLWAITNILKMILIHFKESF